MIVVLAGCGTSSETTGEKRPAEGIIATYTPGAGGIAYILSAGVSSIFNSDAPMEGVQLVTEATNGGAEIIYLVLDKEKQSKTAIGLNSVSEIVQAYNGELKLIPGTHDSLRAISYITYSAAHMLTAEKSGIQSYADLKGKRIGLPPGSATEAIVKALLKDGYGLEEGDYRVYPLSYNEISEGIQDGSLDAGPLLGAVPAALVHELSQLHDVRLLNIDEEAEQKFLEANPYYSVKEVEANTYQGQEETVKIPSLEVIAFTHENADDELVYQFVDTILSNGDALVEVHPIAKELIPENILQGTDQLPLHPGAEKYYREKGLIE